MILWSEYTSNISYYVSGHSQPILNRIKIQSDFAKLKQSEKNIMMFKMRKMQFIEESYRRKKYALKLCDKYMQIDTKDQNCQSEREK